MTNLAAIKGLPNQEPKVIAEIGRLEQTVTGSQNKRESVVLVNQRASLVHQTSLPSVSTAPEHIRVYLAVGKVVNMYRNQNGHKKQMHIFVCPSMKEIICKRPKKQVIKLHWRMQVQDIVDLRLYEDQKENSFKASGFGRHKNLFRSAPNPRLCLSLVGPTDLTGRQQKFHL